MRTTFHSRAHRRSVTLLELLIVIAILSIVGGILTLSIRKALVDQSFRAEVGLIVDDLRLAQELMLVFDTDIHMKFKEKSNQEGIDFWLDSETKLPSPLHKLLIDRPHKELKMIRGVFFKDENTNEVTEGYLDIRFLSRGFVMSQGIMRLATSSEDPSPDNVLQTYIVLAGYPHPIESMDSKEDADKIYEGDEDEDFVAQLTQDTLSKLPEKFKESATAPESGTREEPDESEDEKKGKPEKESIIPPPKKAA